MYQEMVSAALNFRVFQNFRAAAAVRDALSVLSGGQFDIWKSGGISTIPPPSGPHRSRFQFMQRYEKSEPFTNSKQVRIFVFWWR